MSVEITRPAWRTKIAQFWFASLATSSATSCTYGNMRGAPGRIGSVTSLGSIASDCGSLTGVVGMRVGGLVGAGMGAAVGGRVGVRVVATVGVGAVVGGLVGGRFTPASARASQTFGQSVLAPSEDSNPTTKRAPGVASAPPAWLRTPWRTRSAVGPRIPIGNRRPP